MLKKYQKILSADNGAGTVMEDLRCFIQLTNSQPPKQLLKEWFLHRLKNNSGSWEREDLIEMKRSYSIVFNDEEIQKIYRAELNSESPYLYKIIQSYEVLKIKPKFSNEEKNKVFEIIAREGAGEHQVNKLEKMLNKKEPYKQKRTRVLKKADESFEGNWWNNLDELREDSGIDIVFSKEKISQKLDGLLEDERWLALDEAQNYFEQKADNRKAQNYFYKLFLEDKKGYSSYLQSCGFKVSKDILKHFFFKDMKKGKIPFDIIRYYGYGKDIPDGVFNEHVRDKFTDSYSLETLQDRLHKKVSNTTAQLLYAKSLRNNDFVEVQKLQELAGYELSSGNKRLLQKKLNEVE